MVNISVKQYSSWSIVLLYASHEHFSRFDLCFLLHLYFVDQTLLLIQNNSIYLSSSYLMMWKNSRRLMICWSGGISMTMFASLFILLTSVWPMTLSWYDKVLILNRWVKYNFLKIFHSIQLKLLWSVLRFHFQFPLHVSTVWQKRSLCCAQFQLFNPKIHYMFT